ncbi:hypothetical protein NQ314_004705 [Rhamnusium bicolor]|uniref:HTH CENPB-type domain-containing protein n=1 Tax=Rhamnusium bicolor TaxID=1586634 RepID=A0AAV8ZL78_9CUCU|nr:hypothetical protein NQ314_004705 [Rhamnusium bicolor]
MINDDGYDNDPKENSKYATRKVFLTSEENMLVNYLKQCSNMNYCLTYQQIRVFVYGYAKVLPGCKYPEKWNLGKKAGIEWLHGFMKRHVTLSLRKPESTSLAREIGFNKTRVEEFFLNYRNVLNKYKFTPNRIFNLDEMNYLLKLLYCKPHQM